MDREDLHLCVKSGALKADPRLQGEISSKAGNSPQKGNPKRSRFRLGWIQQQILAYLLGTGLRRFKPAMIPIRASKKEVAEAVARLIRHKIVYRVKHGYYEANLDLIKQISLRKKLPLPGLQGEIQPQKFPPVRGLAPAARQPGKSSQPPAQQPTVQPTAQQPVLTVACNDRKLSRYIPCQGGRIGVVIPNEAPTEILYDNVRGMTPGGYRHGDKSMLLMAEDLARFDYITYAELTVPTFSDYFERAGTLKIYYKCVEAAGRGMICSDFVEWMPPAGYVERYGIPRANYMFRHYIIPAAAKVIQRARQVLARRLPAN